MNHIEYQTSGTCSKQILIDIADDGIIENVQFVGGCHGNTQGVSALIKGMSVEEAHNRLKGIRCGARPTSCPDQLALALEKVM